MEPFCVADEVDRNHLVARAHGASADNGPAVLPCQEYNVVSLISQTAESSS